MKLGAEPGNFRDRMPAALDVCASVEECAQLFARRFYEEYVQSAVLVRVFVTLPWRDLGDLEQTSARSFAQRVDSSAVVGDGCTVLTLLGTFGIEPNWRERALSLGHRAIPLLSRAFVYEIPMITRLLGELGFTDIERSTAAWQYVHRATEGSGIFFVGDARTATDERGRRIIPATEFIETYNVRTVFGFGAPGTRPGAFISVIVFSRDTLTRADAQKYASLSDLLRASTAPLERAGAIFSAR